MLVGTYLESVNFISMVKAIGLTALPKADCRGGNKETNMTRITSILEGVPRADVGVVVPGGVLRHVPALHRAEVVPHSDPRRRRLLHLEVPELRPNSISTVSLPINKDKGLGERRTIQPRPFENASFCASAQR